jgi:Secretion system C-terminal sorting domain
MKSLTHLFFTTCLLVLICNTLNAQQTYKDIAPILINNCTPCHHNGGIAFSLSQYSQVVANNLAIKYDLLSNHMPPWPADPNYKHYVKERVISMADKNAIISWINNGMQAGDTTLAPALPNYGTAQLNGTPDLIINVPKFTSSATNLDHYYCLNVPSGLLQDRYIRAFEFIPGNAALIHHAVITVDTQGTATNDLSGSCYNFQGQINLGDYAPGMGPTVLPSVAPAKFGFRLKANATLSFQIHVPEGTVGEKDSSQLRIYFYPVGTTGIRDMYFQTVLQNWNFSVPANGTRTVSQTYPTGSAGLPIPVSLYGAFPHSHKTCTSILNYAYKGTDTLPLISIPKWDFHWQGQYIFKSMVKVPATYRLYAKHFYDNTVNNPDTPDPNSVVYAGTSTTNEMFFDSYLYSYYQTGDELINIDSLLSNDPLLASTRVPTLSHAASSIAIIPNPNHGIFEIACDQPDILVKVYNTYGVLVANSTDNKIDLSNYANGIYFVLAYSSAQQFIGSARMIKE